MPSYSKELLTFPWKEHSISGRESRENRTQSDISCLTVQKSCDQFDLFAKSIACQLRKMDINSALKLQEEIQSVLKRPLQEETQVCDPSNALFNSISPIRT